MPARSLRYNEQTDNDEGSDHRRGERSAEREAAFGQGLIEEIADGGAERARQDEGRPEQEHARDIGPKIKRGDDGEPDSKDERAAFVAEAAVIGEPIAERGAERLRQGDGGPVEGLDPARRDGVDGNRSLRPIPKAEHGHEAKEKQRRAAGIADAER